MLKKTLYGDKDGYSLITGYTSEEIKEAMKKLQREKKKAEEKLAVVDEKLERMGKTGLIRNTDKDATLMLMKNDSLGVATMYRWRQRIRSLWDSEYSGSGRHSFTAADDSRSRAQFGDERQ